MNQCPTCQRNMGTGRVCLYCECERVDVEVSGIERLVCADIAERQRLGIRKYGVTVEDNPLPLREWLEHAYQEALDLAVYLRRAMEEEGRREKGEGRREGDFSMSL